MQTSEISTAIPPVVNDPGYDMETPNFKIPDNNLLGKTERVLAGKHSRNRLLLFLVLLILALAIVGVTYALRGSGPNSYITSRIERGDIDPTVTTSGNLNAVITVQVGSQVSGNILALYADFNTKVKKGQVVALIDPASFKAAVAQATANVSAAQAAVQTAQATLAKTQSDLASALANIASAKANLAKAKSAVAIAMIENDRTQALLAEKIESQNNADTAKATYDQAVASMNADQASLTAAQTAAVSAQAEVTAVQAQVRQAEAVVQQTEAALAQAQLNLDHTRIVAPVDGTVESRNMDVGQTVAASFQAPTIFLIAQDLTRMQVDTNVDEADVGPIREGQSASFTVDAYPGQIFRGTIAQVRKAPINVQNVITYDVVVEVSNPDLKLYPGMTANATIVTGHAANVLRVPKAALRYRPIINQTRSTKNTDNRTLVQPGPQSQGRQIVYVLDDSQQPLAIPVKLGVGDANYFQLLDGKLSEGTPVIIGSRTRQSAGISALQSTAPSRRSGF